MPDSPAPPEGDPRSVRESIDSGRLRPLPPVMLALLGAVVLSLIYAALLLRADYLAQRVARQEALWSAVEQVRSRTQAYFDAHRAVLEVIALSDCASLRSEAACKHFFAELNARFPDVINFAATDREGRFFASGRPLPAGAPTVVRETFFQALQGGAGVYVMDPHRGPVTGEMVTGLAIPLNDTRGRFDGVVGISTRFAELSVVWGELTLAPDYSLLFFDRQGRLLYARGPAGEGLAGGAPAPASLAALAEADVLRVVLPSGTYQGQAATIDAAQWRVVALLPGAGDFWFYAQQSLRIWQLGLPVLLLVVLGLLSYRRGSQAFRLLVDSRGELARHRDRLEVLVAERTQELVRSEERFRRLVEGSPVAIASSRDGRLTYVNPAFCRTFELDSVDQAVGCSLLDFVAPEAHPAIIERNRLREAGEAVPSHYVTRGRRRDGATFAMEVAVAAVPVEDGLGTLAFILDVTRRMEAEAALREAKEQLERRVGERTRELEISNRELEAFSYSVSHDLRAPLRRVDGFRQMIESDRETRLGSRARDALERMHRAVLLMSTLIEDLLKLAQIARHALSPASCLLSEMAEGILAELREAEPGRAVETRVEAGLRVTADPSLLDLALRNLLQNAWKYTSKTEGALIEVGIRPREDGAFIYFVRDNGAGFDMRQANRLFAPFQRLHAAEEFPGSGIGLATVARVVHRHGGEIWAEAQPGRGATFYFTLAAPGRLLSGPAATGRA